MSFPMGELGPAVVEWDGVSLGDNLEVKVVPIDSAAPVKTARTGTAPDDEVITGREVTIEIQAVKTTLAQLEKIMPSVTVTGSEFMIQNPVGTSKRDIAKEMVIKRIVNGVASSDPKQWLTFFKTAPHANAEWVFDAETQRFTRAMFRAFEVLATESGETFAVGDIGAIGYGQTT